MEEADTEAATTAMQAAAMEAVAMEEVWLGLRSEGDGEEERTKGQKGHFVPVLSPYLKINILFDVVFRSKFYNNVGMQTTLF